jgi:hypothetical protein
MTDLCRVAAAAFYRDNPAFVSAARTTTDTGIRGLVPGEGVLRGGACCGGGDVSSLGNRAAS